MIEFLTEIIKTILSTLQQMNSVVVNYLTGILSVITAIAALAAYQRYSKIVANQDAMQRLADAIIQHNNRKLRDN